jgi:hypothetical protein
MSLPITKEHTIRGIDKRVLRRIFGPRREGGNKRKLEKTAS